MLFPDRLIVSLCDYSGVWSQPYVDAGYKVVRIDKAYPAGITEVSGNLHTIGCDLTGWDFPWRPWGVLAAPSCTVFCRPGARWWRRHDTNGQTDHDVMLFRQCLRLCKTAITWWALENPPGRHRTLMPEIPEPAWQFQPYDYGDPWIKQTYVWGTAVKPFQTVQVQPPRTHRAPSGHTQGVIAMMSGSAKRDRERTPSGFARAFFEANP